MPKRQYPFLVYEIDDNLRISELPIALTYSEKKYDQTIHGAFLLKRISNSEAGTYKAFKLYFEVEIEDLADILDAADLKRIMLSDQRHER